MTDKQIIDDGIDVSGCEYYNKDDKTCREVNGNYDTDICEFDKCENSNCYYKQLKRKEQECEKLKQTIAEIKELVYELTNQEYTDFIEGKQEQILQVISECEVDNAK